MFPSPQRALARSAPRRGVSFSAVQRPMRMSERAGRYERAPRPGHSQYGHDLLAACSVKHRLRGRARRPRSADRHPRLADPTTARTLCTDTARGRTRDDATRGRP